MKNEEQRSRERCAQNRMYPSSGKQKEEVKRESHVSAIAARRGGGRMRECFPCLPPGCMDRKDCNRMLTRIPL